MNSKKTDMCELVVEDGRGTSVESSHQMHSKRQLGHFIFR